MKWVRRFLAIVVVLLIGAFLAFVHYLDALVVQTVNAMGPKWMGVPVTLRGAQVLPLRGIITLNGLTIGNPKGFASDRSIEIGEIRVDVGMRSLFSNTVVISEIRIGRPEIHYEIGLGKSNIGALLDGMSASTNAEPPAASAEPESTNETKVVIDELSINEGRIRIGTKLSEAVAAPIPLPTIRLKDIGRDDTEGEAQGVTPVRVIQDVLRAVLGSITTILTGSVRLVGEGVQAVGNGAIKGVSAVGEGAKAVGKGAVDVAGKSVDVVGDAAKAVGEGAVDVAGKGVDVVGNVASKAGEAVGDGAKAVGGAAVKVGEAVGDGMGKVVDGVEGVFRPEKADRKPDER